MGGNVFGTEPIKKENIRPTLQQFFKELVRIFPNAGIHFDGIETLGSTGKKDVSGDIDLALSQKAFKNIKDWGLDSEEVKQYFDKFKKRARTATKEQLTKRAVICTIADKIDRESGSIAVDPKGSGSGALFCKFPQYSPNGDKLKANVQIDINIGDVDWLKFAYYSARYQGNVKGLHRTQLVLSLFSFKGYTFSHNYGVKSKDTGDIVARSPEEAVQLLNNLYGFEVDQKTLSDYHDLQKFLKSNVDQEDLNEIYGRYLKILDKTRCDIPNDMEDFWLDHQEELGLTGKFLPASSKLYPFREEEI